MTTYLLQYGAWEPKWRRVALWGVSAMLDATFMLLKSNKKERREYIGRIGKGRNQYLKKTSLLNDLDSYQIPKKHGPVVPANVTSAEQC